MDVDGTLYKKPCAVLLKMNVDSELPSFGKVIHIFVVNSKVFFYVQVLDSLYYDFHFHCYNIIVSNQFITVDHTSLFSFHLRVKPGTSGTLCIVANYHFVCS